MQITRRSALALFPLCALAACGVVSTTTTNGVTTITVDLVKLSAYVKAINTGVAALLGDAVIFGAMPAPLSAAVIALGTEMTTALDKLTAQANGAQTLSFDSTSIPGALTSLQGDATTIFGDFQTVMTAVGASVGSQIGTVFAALQTIVAIVQTLTMVAGAKAAAIALRMPEAQALKVLGQ